MGKENKNTFISDISSDMINYIKIILTFTTAVIVFIVLIISGVYLIQLMFDLSIDLIKPLNFIKKIFACIFTYLLTPCITLLISSRIYRQWQIDKFMQFRDKIVIAEQKYRNDSKQLVKKFTEFHDNQLTDELWEEFSDDKEFIISEYLNELEAFALYIKRNIIDQHLAYEYGFDKITGILEDDLLKTYIDEQQQISIDHYKYLILLAEEWIKEKKYESKI